MAFRDGQAMREVIQQYVQEMADALDRMDDAKLREIEAAAKMLVDCYGRGNAVYILGNGGSAADAQHIAAELVARFIRERRALPCLALTTDTSALTAIGNDYSFDRVFARQVEAFVRSGDIVWAISTSGNSGNILAAVQQARSQGAHVLGFTGGDGGKLKAMCDVCFVAPDKKTATIQQIHQLAYHAICDIVEQSVTE